MLLTELVSTEFGKTKTKTFVTANYRGRRQHNQPITILYIFKWPAPRAGKMTETKSRLGFVLFLIGWIERFSFEYRETKNHHHHLYFLSLWRMGQWILLLQATRSFAATSASLRDVLSLCWLFFATSLSLGRPLRRLPSDAKNQTKTKPK